jgi:hypothetical protein
MPRKYFLGGKDSKHFSLGQMFRYPVGIAPFDAQAAAFLAKLDGGELAVSTNISGLGDRFFLYVRDLDRKDWSGSHRFGNGADGCSLLDGDGGGLGFEFAEEEFADDVEGDREVDDRFPCDAEDGGDGFENGAELSVRHWIPLETVGGSGLRSETFALMYS